MEPSLRTGWLLERGVCEKWDPVVNYGALESAGVLGVNRLYLEEVLTQLSILKVSVFRANTQVWF